MAKAFLIPILIATALGFAQAPVELQPTGASNIEGVTLATALVMPAKCDADDNVWVRIYADPVNTSPLWKLPPSGTASTLHFDGSGVTETNLIDFAPDPRGGLRVLAWLRPRDERPDRDYYMLAFGSDGKFSSKTKLDIDFAPQQIAVFRSGDVIIAGQQLVDTSAGRTFEGGRPVVALVNSAGQIRKHISTKGDVDPAKQSADEGTSGGFDFSLQTSTLEGTDGDRAYLLRRGANGPLFVIASNGDVLRTITFTGPNGSSLLGVKPGHGQVVAVFATRKPRPQGGQQIDTMFFRVYDAESGKQLWEFSRHDSALGASLVCYSNRTFTFLRPGRGMRGLEFVMAKP